MIGGNDIILVSYKDNGITLNVNNVIGKCYNINSAKDIAKEYISYLKDFNYTDYIFKYRKTTFKIK